MARIFISHSSRDNFEALAFRNWLLAEGWASDDVFIDLHGIGAGARWREALAKANERCEAVLFLVSPHSLASNECYAEIRMADEMGKVILPTILPARVPEDRLALEDPRLAVHRERQIVDASIEPREAAFTVEHEGQRRTAMFHAPTLARIKARLEQLGISPDSFPWAPADLDTATPFPGLGGFTQGEAALFFGRAGDIARGFSSLRKLRRTALNSGQGGLLVIQAASGAGKSSFLRAGLWPRLLRDPDFVPIGILRPATGILTGDNGVGRQLAAFFARHNRPRPAFEIHRDLKAGAETAAKALAELIAEATEIGRDTHRFANPDSPPPSPIIAVDQAEELFAASDAEESGRFWSLVASLIGAGSTPTTATGPLAPLFVWTIRADSMDALLHATSAGGLAAPELFPLPPIARTNYAEIINGPLAVANKAGMRLSIDPLLTHKLVEASEGADALPLLAYTLRQLIEDNRTGSRAHVTLEAFESSGGIGGVLRKRLAAAQSAAGTDDQQLKALFVPRLATWDADSHPPGLKRLVADEDELFGEGRGRLKPLADALVAERLLTRSGEAGGPTTLEVAHEALLRQPPIADWLEEAREFLVWRDTIGRARRAFEANARSHLMGRELEIARGWIERDTDGSIPHDDRAFIEASIAQDEARRTAEAEKERKRQAAELQAAQERENSAKAMAAASRNLARRTLVGLVAALVLAVAAGAAGFYAWTQQQDAIRQATSAEARKRETEKLRDETQFTESGLLARSASALLGARDEGDAGTAMLLALEALPDTSAGLARNFAPEAQVQLDRAMRLLRERAMFGDGAKFATVETNATGTRIVTTSADGSARVWDATTGKKLARLVHDERIAGAAYSPDGSRILTWSADKTARIWDETTGMELVRFVHEGSVLGAKFSPDGSRIMTTSGDRSVRVWDAATGKELVRLALDGHVRTAAFSVDGGRILTDSLASIYMQVRVWDAATGNELHRLDSKDVLLTTSHVAFSGDGAHVVIAPVVYANDARVWDATTGTELARLVHDDWINGAVYSADGGRILTASSDKTARVWDAATGKELGRLVHDNAVASAVFSADGGRILTASSDKTARLWDTATGKELVRLVHDAPVSRAAFTANDKRIVTASEDGMIRVWDTAVGNELVGLNRNDSRSYHAAFSPDGARIVTAPSWGGLFHGTSNDKTARVWDAVTGNELIPLAHGGRVQSVAFSADSRLILTGSEDKTARVWDAATGRELVRLIHEGQVFDAKFSSDGGRILTTSSRLARVWDAATGKELARFAHEGGFQGASISDDGGRILTWSDDKTARIWDAATGKELARFVHDDKVEHAAFSPDGSRVVTVSMSKMARVWDASTGKELAQLAHSGSVRRAVFSVDGSRIVTASDDKTARVWDAATGKELVRLVHDGSVSHADFSLDGRRILTFSGDTARAWDTVTGRELSRFDRVLSGFHWEPAFSVDGASVITMSHDLSTNVWRTHFDTRKLVDAAKDRAPRCLTPDQRKAFFLPSAPPMWCVERRLWPYQTEAWQSWLRLRKVWQASGREGEEPALP